MRSRLSETARPLSAVMTFALVQTTPKPASPRSMTTYRNSWHAAILQRMSQSKSHRIIYMKGGRARRYDAGRLHGVDEPEHDLSTTSLSFLCDMPPFLLRFVSMYGWVQSVSRQQSVRASHGASPGERASGRAESELMMGLRYITHYTVFLPQPMLVKVTHSKETHTTRSAPLAPQIASGATVPA